LDLSSLSSLLTAVPLLIFFCYLFFVLALVSHCPTSAPARMNIRNPSSIAQYNFFPSCLTRPLIPPLPPSPPFPPPPPLPPSPSSLPPPHSPPLPPPLTPPPPPLPPPPLHPPPPLPPPSSPFHPTFPPPLPSPHSSSPHPPAPHPPPPTPPLPYYPSRPPLPPPPPPTPSPPSPSSLSPPPYPPLPPIPLLAPPPLLLPPPPRARLLDSPITPLLLLARCHPSNPLNSGLHSSLLFFLLHLVVFLSRSYLQSGRAYFFKNLSILFFSPFTIPTSPPFTPGSTDPPHGIPLSELMEPAVPVLFSFQEFHRRMASNLS